MKRYITICVMCLVFVFVGCATPLVQVKTSTCKPVPYLDEAICEMVKKL